MSSACFLAADEYVVPDAVVFSSGYDSTFSAEATVSLAQESVMAAVLSYSS